MVIIYIEIKYFAASRRPAIEPCKLRKPTLNYHIVGAGEKGADGWQASNFQLKTIQGLRQRQVFIAVK